MNELPKVYVVYRTSSPGFLGKVKHCHGTMTVACMRVRVVY